MFLEIMKWYQMMSIIGCFRKQVFWIGATKTKEQKGEPRF